MKKYVIAFISCFVSVSIASIIPTILFYGPEQAELSKLFPGVVNEVPDPLFILISATALIILWVITFDKMGITNFKNGSITGIWFGALTFTFFGFQFMALTNIVSIQFALTDIFISAIMGAIQGFFGGLTDLILQRVIEIWAAVPSLYVIIIMFAILGRSFWLLVFLMILFGWTGLVGVVRAEFLRARNLEYVRAARALGVSDWTIMFRHMLPNAMVATLTMLPFIVTGTIAGLASLDFLGFGLPTTAPSLGELTLQAKQNLQAPWLGFTAFFTFAIMLALLVFIFEGVRDAFDPRKTFK